MLLRYVDDVQCQCQQRERFMGQCSGKAATALIVHPTIS